MSIKPGATTLPPASMVRVRDALARFPMAAILPSRIPTSAEYHGEPVPSTMWPLVMMMSKYSGKVAVAGKVQLKKVRSAKKSGKRTIRIVDFLLLLDFD